MKIYILLLCMLPGMLQAAARGDKNDQKNKKLVEKEESRFEKNVEAHPGSAQPYLDHANNLAAIPSETGRAAGFYQLALRYDSANVQLFKSYGIYLVDKMHNYAEAKAMLSKAIALQPGDEEVKSHIATADRVLAARDADDQLRDFGTTTLRDLGAATEYTAISNLDSLKRLTTLPGNPYYYPALLTRYLEGGQLTPADMYLLLIGYTGEASYSAFSYTAINEMKGLAAYNIDSALNHGLELTKTNPLNPTLNREIMYYYRRKNQPDDAAKYKRRILLFFDGVLFSGNGTCTRPYIALWSKEEYNFLIYLGYKATDSHYMGTCAGHMAETIEATDAAGKVVPVNFNVALIYLQAVGK